MKRRMTIRAFKERLSQYPDEALCCGTFWLEEDFLSLDDSLDVNTIEAAMGLAQDKHDADSGFNQDYLRDMIEEVKRGG